MRRPRDGGGRIVWGIGVLVVAAMLTIITSTSGPLFLKLDSEKSMWLLTRSGESSEVMSKRYVLTTEEQKLLQLEMRTRTGDIQKSLEEAKSRVQETKRDLQKAKDSHVYRDETEAKRQQWLAEKRRSETVWFSIIFAVGVMILASGLLRFFYSPQRDDV